jgi:predicted acyltransferase
MSLPPGAVGSGPLGKLTDEEPIVIHPPVHGAGSEPPASAALAPVTPEASQAIGAPAGVAAPARDLTPLDAQEPRVPASGGARVRARSLDALRGFFLLLMTLGFTIHGRMFPEWMYHRQFPPPGDLMPIAGLTWRDLAYAAFLFTMAAALPITLSRRIESGETEIATMLAVLRRFILLFAFALLIGHSNTYFTGYTQETRVLAIAGFFIMFAAFTRRRADWNEAKFRVLNVAGWIAAILFLALSPLLYDSAFSPARRDDIIAGLAFAALSGSVVWYFTRNKLGARLVILAGAVALYLASRGTGWVQEWWWSSPAPWLMRPSSLVLLTVVIPGTIAGDLLLRWMRSTPAESAPYRWSALRLGGLTLLSIATVPITVVGLYNRWVLGTTQLILLLCLAGFVITRRASHPAEQLVRQLFMWGTLWLLLGLIMDPAEGGIRKVPETLSYFFTVTGVTMMLLVAFVISVDLLKHRHWSRILVDVGHNPMLAYVLYTVFLNSLLELIPPLRGVLRASPGEAILRSLVITAVVALTVQAFSRRKIFWRT